jgi:hypothetical protein
MEALRLSNLHNLIEELQRWRDVIDEDYRQHRISN